MPILPSIAGRAVNYQVEETLGNIPGRSIEPLIFRNPAAGPVFEDIWCGGAYDFPTGPEVWEAVSDSDEDKVGSSGASSLDVISLDADYNLQITTVVLNGLSPVVISNTHIRPKTVVVTDGSVGSATHNVGNVTIRVSGGGQTRNYMPATFCNSQDGHYTVPAGETVTGIQVVPVLEKNSDMVIRSKITRFGVNQPTFIGAEIPIYQGNLVLPILAPFILP